MHFERERPSAQKLGDTLQALEAYLQPLSALLSCPEARCRPRRVAAGTEVAPRQRCPRVTPKAQGAASLRATAGGAEPPGTPDRPVGHRDEVLALLSHPAPLTPPPGPVCGGAWREGLGGIGTWRSLDPLPARTWVQLPLAGIPGHPLRADVAEGAPSGLCASDLQDTEPHGARRRGQSKGQGQGAEAVAGPG